MPYCIDSNPFLPSSSPSSLSLPLLLPLPPSFLPSLFSLSPPSFLPSLLSTAIEFIEHAHHERDHRERQMQALHKEQKELNAAIAKCQENLPASGVPVTRQVHGLFSLHMMLFANWRVGASQPSHTMGNYAVSLRMHNNYVMGTRVAVCTVPPTHQKCMHSTNISLELLSTMFLWLWFHLLQRFEENRQRFQEYVRKRTLQNYKFWIVSFTMWIHDL